MTYDIIEIKPKSIENELGEEVDREWMLTFRQFDDRVERQDTFASPNALGFFIYPTTMSEQEAFYKLKEAMIERHVKKIRKLVESLNKLTELKITDQE